MKIKLVSKGRKTNYKIIVVNPKGKVLDRLGYYMINAKQGYNLVKIDKRKLSYWLLVGAKVSRRLLKLLRVLVV